MTRKTFYKWLSKASEAFNWTHKYKNIRTEVGGHCPITAVAELKTGMYFLPDEYPEAAEAIGLDSADADRIALCADQSDLLDPYKELPVRKTLLRRLGLEE